METSWRGIFPSLPTPFSPDGDLDVPSQRSVVRFAADHGAHGLICFGLAGEVFRLTPDERLQLLTTIVEESAGRIPVLAGVGLESEHGSIRLARARPRLIFVRSPAACLCRTEIRASWLISRRRWSRFGSRPNQNWRR